MNRNSIAAFAVVAVLAAGCKDEAAAIAVLRETSPGTTKQTGSSAWADAPVGTEFFRGDSVRTDAGSALLALGKAAALRVQPHSLIRFGERDGKDSLEIGVGEATLEGSAGKYQLGVGAVSLEGQSRIRIAAAEPGGPGGQVELMLGKATIEANGQVTALEIGKPYTLGMGEPVMVRPDASRVPDAAVVDAVPPPDAAPEAAKVSVVITGKKAQVQAKPGDKWKAQPAGTVELKEGASLKLGVRTTAKAKPPGLTVSVSTGATLAVGKDPIVGLTTGKASAVGESGAEGKLALPGGFLLFKQNGGTAGATVEVLNKRETRVVVTAGNIEMNAKRQGKLELRQGDKVVLLRDGTWEVKHVIPSYFDLRVTAGQKFYVHDPKPGTAVRFAFDCPAGGVVQLDRPGFRAPRESAGTDGANLMVPAGSWVYRIKCGGKVKANGRVTVRHDDARRQLPTGPPAKNTVDADGYKYKVYFQNLVPNVVFRWKEGTGSGFTLKLNKGAANQQTFTGSEATIEVPGKVFSDGLYTYWMENANGQRSKTSFLSIIFDNASSSAYIEEPDNGKPFGATIKVKGATLPGWSVSIEGVAVQLDRQGRFDAQVGPPPGNALAIKLSHAKGGTHYYLRRQR